jgi:hypothetical protein
MVVSRMSFFMGDLPQQGALAAPEHPKRIVQDRLLVCNSHVTVGHTAALIFVQGFALETNVGWRLPVAVEDDEAVLAELGVGVINGPGAAGSGVQAWTDDSPPRQSEKRFDHVRIR